MTLRLAHYKAKDEAVAGIVKGERPHSVGAQSRRSTPPLSVSPKCIWEFRNTCSNRKRRR